MTVRFLGLVLCLGLLLSPSAASAEDESIVIDRCDSVLRASKDPVERFDAVRRLAACTHESVPRRLARIVRGDADPLLRAEAAAGLGTTADASADEILLGLVVEGGVRCVRTALAGSLAKRGVTPGRIVSEIRTRRRDAIGQALLLESLAAVPDVLAAGHLDVFAQTHEGPLRETALRALADHPHGKLLAPDAVDSILGTATDVDTLVTALGVAERVGDERVRRHELRLRSLKEPLVDVALDVALSFVAWRAAGASRGLTDTPPRTRDAVDRVHVFHEGPQLARVWGRVLDDFTSSRPRYEDVRVALVIFRDPTATQRRATVEIVPFTRDAKVIEQRFTTMKPQVGNPDGVAIAQAIEDGLDRVGWRPGVDGAATLHGDVEPKELTRTRAAATLHYQADRIPLLIHLLSAKPGGAPDGLVRLAAASNRLPIVPALEPSRAPRKPPGSEK